MQHDYARCERPKCDHCSLVEWDRKYGGTVLFVFVLAMLAMALFIGTPNAG